MYPERRLRRNRLNSAMRRMTETFKLSADDFILPLFVTSGQNKKESIETLPGVYRYSSDKLADVVSKVTVPAVLLFGVPDEGRKDESGSSALDSAGIIPMAISAIKSVRPDLCVITDVCLCAYTNHGHCGVLNENDVDNDKTLVVLADMAVVHAKAGADIIAPSAMMDGQVAAIRDALDDNGFNNKAIMSYSTKFASSFYGPFREAAKSSPDFGDRSSYQLGFSDKAQAVIESLEDEKEGADWLMVKPAVAYLDVLSEIRSKTLLPIAAYHVSGEYAMLKYAAKAGVIDERKAVIETMTAIKRSGANAIITYYAEEICQWLGF